MHILMKLYKGDYSLAKSYWLFGNVIPAGLFALIFSIILFNSDDPMNTIITQNFAPQSLLVSIIVIILCLLTLFYILFSVVGIWRSANKHVGKKVWPILAKITIVVGLLLNLKSLLKFF